MEVAELPEDAEAEDCSSLRPLLEDVDVAALPEEAPEAAWLLDTAAVALASACTHTSCWSAGP